MAAICGGSHETIEPSVQYGGSTESTSYFMSDGYRHGGLNIEASPDDRCRSTTRPTEYQGFVYVDHITYSNNRVSFVGGYANRCFQIPHPAGVRPDVGYTVAGQSACRSEDLNERQLERTGFGLGHLFFGVDGYYRQSRNLVDEEQLGAPIILTPLNYHDGRTHGVEFNASYAQGAVALLCQFRLRQGAGPHYRFPSPRAGAGIALRHHQRRRPGI